MLVDGPVGVMLPGTMVATVFCSGSCRAAASKISLAGLEGVGRRSEEPPCRWRFDKSSIVWLFQVACAL